MKQLSEMFPLLIAFILHCYYYPYSFVILVCTASLWDRQLLGEQ